MYGESTFTVYLVNKQLCEEARVQVPENVYTVIDFSEKSHWFYLVGVESNPGPAQPRSRARRGRQTRRRNTKKTANSDALATLLASSGVRVNPFNRVQSTFPSNRQFFPDILWAEATTIITNGLNSVVNAAYTFIGNSPMFNYGPQINYSGSFQNNVPAGANYLLSSSTSTGAVRAPYGLSWCYASEIEIDIINNGSVAFYATLVPADFPSLASMSVSQIGEQRGATQLLLPGNMSTSTNTMKLKVNWYDIFGVSKDVYLNDLHFAQAAGSTPGQPSWFHFIVNAFDATSNISTVYKMKILNKFKFASLNPYTTTVPA